MEHNGKPITELTDSDDKVKAFQVLKDNAYQASLPSIRRSEHNHMFYAGDHYLSEGKDGSWSEARSRPGTEASMRTFGSDIFDSVQSLLPLFVRNEPDIQIKPEDPNVGVDLRTLNDQGVLTGRSSRLSQAKTAEIATDIYNTVQERNAEIVKNAMIILESMLSGAAYVTFRIDMNSRQGIQVEPHLLKRENFMPDPDGLDWWDFADYRYVIIRSYMTPSEIQAAYGITEEKYAEKGTSISINPFNFVAKWRGKRTQEDKYGLRKYPVDIMYYSHYLPLIGYVGEDIKKDIPIPKQFIFINEKYLASEIDIPFSHMEFPVTSFVASPVYGSQDGISNVSQLVGTQLAIDLLTNATIDSARLMGNPGIIADESAKPTDGWRFGPGGVTYMPKGKFNQWTERAGGQLNQAALAVVQVLKQNLRETGGDESGILRGGTPSNVKSGRHANVVLNSLLTRHSFTTTMYDASWLRHHRLRFSTMQQIGEFDTPHWKNQNDVVEYAGWKEAVRNLQYDMSLESKADLPFSPAERIQQVVFLWQLGLADINYVIKTLDLNLGADLEEHIREQNPPESFIAGIPGPELALLRSELAVAQQQQQQGAGQAGEGQAGAGEEELQQEDIVQ